MIKKVRQQIFLIMEYYIPLSVTNKIEIIFRPIILDVEPKRELHWIGRLAVPGLFSGEHIFTIEPLGKNHVRFIHREIFTGLFVLIYAGNFDKSIRRGFEEMNQALKAQAEQSLSLS